MNKTPVWQWLITCVVGIFAGYCKLEAETKSAAKTAIESNNFTNNNAANNEYLRNAEQETCKRNSLKNSWKIISNKDKVHSVVFASIYSVSAAIVTNFACKSLDNLMGVEAAAGLFM